MNLIHRAENLQLYQGDARQMDEIVDGSVHLIVTSPPYFNARPEYSSWPTYEAYLSDMAQAWRECYRVLCDGGRIAVNVPQGYGRPGNGGYIRIGDHTATALENAGFSLRGIIVWHKSEIVGLSRLMGTAWGTYKSARNPSLRDGHELIIVGHRGMATRGPSEDTIDSETFLAATRSVWPIPPAAQFGRSWHPAPFPAELPRRLIELYSFCGDVVLDPFGGTMTTAFVAAKLGRIGIGLDLNEEYVRHAAGPMFCQHSKGDHQP